MLQFGHVGWFDVYCWRFGVLRERELPLCGGLADAAGFFVEVTQVLVDGGVGPVAFDGTAEIFFG